MEDTQITTVMPLEVTLELQKCVTIEAATTVLIKSIAQKTKDCLGKVESAALSSWLDRQLKTLVVCDEILKKSLKKEAIEKGELTSDAGSKKLQMGGFIVPVTAKGKDSYDDKKVEALLRANNLPPVYWMDEHKSYTVNEKKLEEIKNANPHLALALESCKKEVTYALMPLKRVNNDNE